MIDKQIGIIDFNDLWMDSPKFDRINIELDPGTEIILSNVKPGFEPVSGNRPEQWYLIKDYEEVLRFNNSDEIRHAFITVKGIQYIYWRKGKYQSRCVEEE